MIQLRAAVAGIKTRSGTTPSSQMEKQLLGVSARQIDQRLQAKKSERKRRIYGRTKLSVEASHPG